jgi:hypothetical protein
MDEQDDEEMDQMNKNKMLEVVLQVYSTPWSIIRVNVVVTVEGTSIRLEIFNSMIVV